MQFTYFAHKAIRMELTVERADVIFHDCTIAASALGSEHVKVVLFTVRLTVLFMKTIVAKLLTALNAEKVLGVPCFVHCSNAFLWVGKIYGKF